MWKFLQVTVEYVFHVQMDNTEALAMTPLLDAKNVLQLAM
jgi:hypothetical protein